MRNRLFILPLSFFLIAFLSPLSSAQNQFLEAPQYPTGLQPQALVIADFNRDGSPDLAVVDLGSNRVSLLTGTGDGRFNSKVDFATGTGPSAVVAGDFNSDGNFDVAVTDLTAHAVSILLGNGDGTFQTHVDYQVGNSPAAIVSADFNGDGKLDLAVCNSHSNTVSVLLGKGDGTFQSQLSNPVGNSPRSLTSGDFNGDGRPDLAVVNSGDNNASILLGNGNGTFQFPINYSTGTHSAFVVAGDLNGDAKLDLVVSNLNDSTEMVLLGNGDGTFQTGTTIGDQSSFGPSWIVAADFNGDHKADLAITNYGSRGSGVTIGLAVGKGDGTFHSFRDYGVGSGPLSLAAADLNHDGKLDLAVVNEESNSVSILLGSGNGKFRARADFIACSTSSRFCPTPSALIAADVNLDGKLDLVGSTYSGITTVPVLLGNGDGTFQAVRKTNGASGGSLGIAVGDFNEDGKQDVAATNVVADTISILLGNSDGTFGKHVDYAAGDGPAGVVAADFNGDGHMDLAIGNEAIGLPGTVSVLLGKGDGSFQPAVQYSAVSYSASVAAGDFNHDGILDLAVGNYGYPSTTNLVSILLGKGDGTFQPHVDYVAASAPYRVVVTDLNLDGNLDLVVGTGDGVAVLLGNGDGTFQPPALYSPVGAVWVVVADFNGDGFPDVAVGRIVTSTISVLYGSGDGALHISPFVYAVPGSTGALVAGDFNADGAPDLAAADAYGQTIGILLNTGGH